MSVDNFKKNIKLIKDDYHAYYEEKVNSNSIQSKYLLYVKNALFKILKPIYKMCCIESYVLDRTLDVFCLQKDYMPKNIKEVTIPPEIQVDYSITNEFEFAEEEIKKSVNSFVEVIEKDIPKELLAFFYRNINSFNMETDETLCDNYYLKRLGYYDIKDNKVVVLEKDNENTIFHELFHLSSTYFDSVTNQYYCGLSVGNFGRGINEGYTDLLAKRYLNSSFEKLGYPFEYIIVKIIEEIVGEEKMKSFYFSANLNDLIEELSKYKTREEVIQFIRSVDFLSKYMFDKKFLPTKEKKLSHVKEVIVHFLNDVYCQKIKFDLDIAVANGRHLSYYDLLKKVLHVYEEFYVSGFIDTYPMFEDDFDFSNFFAENVGDSIEKYGIDSVMLTSNEKDFSRKG